MPYSCENCGFPYWDYEAERRVAICTQCAYESETEYDRYQEELEERPSDPVAELGRLLDEAGVRVSMSQWCRSGVVGHDCICWRCRGEGGPTDDESKAEATARKIDRDRLASRR